MDQTQQHPLVFVTIFKTLSYFVDMVTDFITGYSYYNSASSFNDSSPQGVNFPGSQDDEPAKNDHPQLDKRTGKNAI